MVSKTQDYYLLSTEDEAQQNNQARGRHYRPALSAWKLIIGLFVLALSLTANLTLLIRATQSECPRLEFAQGPTALSKYARLPRNIPVPIERSTPYSSHNLTQVRQLWSEISIDDGMIALPDAFVAETGLPQAQRFPWDHSKGLYFLNGYHNLHCLRAVHISLTEFATGEPQSRYFGHVLHCMDSLRQDILCNADDTPRYTTSTLVPESGIGQVRQCRSWEGLQGWAQRYNACYRFINQTASGFPNVLRYRFCPDGSPYKAEVERVFKGFEAREER